MFGIENRAKLLNLSKKKKKGKAKKVKPKKVESEEEDGIISNTIVKIIIGEIVM